MSETEKKRYPIDKLLIGVLLLVVIILLIVGINRQKQTVGLTLPETIDQENKIVPIPLPDTLSFAGENVPLNLFYVRESLEQELTINAYWHSATLQLIKRSNRWFPLIDSILQKNGIPADFRYVAVIESGLQNVISPAGATGFWQFLKDTGKEYGLEINDEVDERYHVAKSTEAASSYLQKGYNKFKNWTMVAASYNAGMNGIERLADEQESNSYYDLLTSAETSRYIFRVLALKVILENPESYGFYVEKQDLYPPIPVRFITVNDRVVSWTVFAREQGISYKLLKYFNPWLRDKSLKNKNKKTYKIAIPDPPFNLTEKSLDR